MSRRTGEPASRRLPDAAAVIVAGGQGTRFGGPVRKQYLVLKGRPILWWSLRAFQNARSVHTIVLVVPADDVASLRCMARRWKFSKVRAIVAGGATRADSVRNGVAQAPSSLRLIAVHDAVRPLVTPALIEQTLREARRHRAAIAATPSRDTVKLANGDGCIHSTPPRDTVWLAQTPQSFERRILERAHSKGHRLAVTDDAQLVERLGVRVRLVEAPPENLKITRPVDLEMARLILKTRHH